MTKHNLQTALLSWLLSSALSIGSVMCPVTGFDLPVGNFPRLLLICSAAALCGSILFQLSNPIVPFCGLSATFCICLWLLKIPPKQLPALIQHIGQVYNLAYQWTSPADVIPAQAADFPLLVTGFGTACAVSFWFCQGRGLFLALVFPALPVLACFVVTDTPPEEKYLFLILAGFAMMILTASVRKRSAVQGNRLMLQAILPVLGFLGLLFLLVPQEGYVNRSAALRRQLYLQTQSLAQQSANYIRSSLDHTPRVDLTGTLDPPTSSFPVMTVTGAYTGTLYLRGQDYDCYTGSGWIAEAQRKEILGQPGTGEKAVTIRTRYLQKNLFIPCTPAVEISITGGRAVNQRKLLEYQIPVLPHDGENAHPGVPLQEEGPYLALPEAAAAGAASLLAGFLPASGSTGQRAAAIAVFVQNRGVYNLQFQKMPPQEQDFALWFLEEARQGSCIHFATAAAVLLRAAGIPARYVTGYMVWAEAGKPIPVTSRNAHAWVEYYDPEKSGWQILEATPPASRPVPREEAAMEAAPLPEASTPEGSEDTPTPSLPVFILPSALAVLVLFPVLQRSVRLMLRRRRWHRLPARMQALELWKEAELLSRLLKQPPTETVLVLMQKTLYSQHDLSEAEIEQLESYLRTCRRQLQQKPRYIRLVHQYLYAIY